MQDRNFDDIAEKFSQNIYGTTKGRIRQAILWQDLDALLASFPEGPLSVLDAGGEKGKPDVALPHAVIRCCFAMFLQRCCRAPAALPMRKV